MKIIIAFMITTIILVSCKNTSEPNDYAIEENIPYGTWVYSENNDSISIYYAAHQFEDDKAGLAFKEDKVFIERTSGWCATPPLSFSNVDGTWEIFDDHTLKITSPNWISENHSRLMVIVSLNKFELKVIFRSLPE